MVESYSVHLEATIRRVIQLCCTRAADSSYCPVTRENFVDVVGCSGCCVMLECSVVRSYSAQSGVASLLSLLQTSSRDQYQHQHTYIIHSNHHSRCASAVHPPSSQPPQAPAMSQSPESSTSLLCAASTPLAAPLAAMPTTWAAQLHPIAPTLLLRTTLPLSMLTSRRTVSSKISGLYVRC
jgi:hypothetical protein